MTQATAKTVTAKMVTAKTVTAKTVTAKMVEGAATSAEEPARTRKRIPGSRPAQCFIETPDGSLRPATAVEVGVARLRLLWRINGYTNPTPEAIAECVARVEASEAQKAAAGGASCPA